MPKTGNPSGQGKPNKHYMRVAEVYAQTLRELGKEAEAARLEAEIAALKSKDN